MLAWVSLRCLRQALLAAAARASLCLATLSQTTTRAGAVLAVLNQVRGANMAQQPSLRDLQVLCTTLLVVHGSTNRVA